jgi:hypothetical protein
MARASIAFSGVKDAADLTLAHDWVSQIREVGVANPDNVPEALRRAWASDAMEKIRTAPILWLLLPETETVGAWCEFAMAVAFHAVQNGPRRRVVTSGPNAARYRSIFTALAHQHYPTDAEALNDLRIFARTF